MDQKLSKLLQQRAASHGNKLPDTSPETSSSVSKVLKTLQRADVISARRP